MDESSADNLKKEINPPSKTELIRELYDPLAFMSDTVLRRLRNKRRMQATVLIAIAVGLPLFTYIFDKLLFPNGSQATGVMVSRSGIGGLILTVLLIYSGFRGLYDAMTVNKAIADNRRYGLLLLHPELRNAEIERQKTHKDSPWPKRVIWTVIMLPIIYTLLFFMALRLRIITAD